MQNHGFTDQIQMPTNIMRSWRGETKQHGRRANREEEFSASPFFYYSIKMAKGLVRNLCCGFQGYVATERYRPLCYRRLTDDTEGNKSERNEKHWCTCRCINSRRSHPGHGGVNGNLWSRDMDLLAPGPRPDFIPTELFFYIFPLLNLSPCDVIHSRYRSSLHPSWSRTVISSLLEECGTIVGFDWH